MGDNDPLPSSLPPIPITEAWGLPNFKIDTKAPTSGSTLLRLQNLVGRSVVSTEATETGTRRETGSCRPKWSPIPTTAVTWIPVSEPRGKLSSGHLSGVGFGWYLARISLQEPYIVVNICIFVVKFAHDISLRSEKLWWRLNIILNSLTYVVKDLFLARPISVIFIL